MKNNKIIPVIAIGAEMIEVLKNVEGFNSEKVEEIEKIAWQMFQNKMNIRFKRELTVDARKSITDVESYQYFREEATKLYNKKQRALSNKRYPIIDVKASGVPTFYGGAYCLCFVYSKYNGNFVLRGYIKEVDEYLKKNYTHYFYNKSLWHQGINRDIWGFWKDDISIFHPSKKDKDQKIVVRPYGGWYHREEDAMDKEEIIAKTFKFKRLPKRWIPEFDKL